MSRTFRRANFEKAQASRNNSGHKYGGFYTTWDRCHEPTGNGHGGCPNYRPMTEAERNQRYHEIHGESKHNNAWGPNRYYRNKAERKMRLANERELERAVTSLDYEAMFYSRYGYEWDSYYW